MSKDYQKILFQTALRYLGYRDRFRKEIEVRLKKQILKKKLPEETFKLIPGILTKLEKAGLVNDQDLIDRYIKNQQENKLRGPFAIKQKLFQMGAPKDQVNKSIDKLVTQESQEATIKQLTKKHKPDLGDPKSLARFQRLLAYRGFSSSFYRLKRVK